MTISAPWTALNTILKHTDSTLLPRSKGKKNKDKRVKLAMAMAEGIGRPVFIIGHPYGALAKLVI